MRLCICVSRRGAEKGRGLNLFITHRDFRLGPNCTKSTLANTGNNILERILLELKKSGFCTDYIQKTNFKYKVRTCHLYINVFFIVPSTHIITYIYNICII